MLEPAGNLEAFDTNDHVFIDRFVTGTIAARAAAANVAATGATVAWFYSGCHK
jgi:hypothetical protein